MLDALAVVATCMRETTSSVYREKFYVRIV